MKTKITKKAIQPARGHLHKLEWVSLTTILFIVLTIGFFVPAVAQETVVTNPASPWTVPDGVTSVKVEVWGGGGGGGGAWLGSGGGGGGGAYNVATLSVSQGQTYSLTIGTGGSSENDGGTTTFSGSGGTVSANGGSAGNNGTLSNGSGGTGGTGGTYNGGNGGSSSGNGAGGGGGAGNIGNGVNGNNAITGTGGAGYPNNAPYTGGDGGAYTTNNGNGNAGNGPGGGGAGAKAGFSVTSGGAGAAGQVVLTYTVVTCPEITPEITFTDISCYGGADGTITIETVKVDGSPVSDPFYYSIDNGETYTPAAVEAPYTFEDLVANEVYEIRVMDSEGCESTDTQQ